MTTFVLIHGMWHGGWCWKKVTPSLRAAGHEVFTPTLTGVGERAHEPPAQRVVVIGYENASHLPPTFL